MYKHLRHKRADPSVVPFLETLERGNREEILAAFAEAAPQGLSLAQLTARTGWSDPEIQQVVKNLVAAKRVRAIGDQPLTIASAKAVAAYAASLRIAARKISPSQSALAGHSETRSARPSRKNERGNLCLLLSTIS